MKRLSYFLFFFLSVHVFAQDTKDLLQGAFVEGITVDLREPKFSDGVLTTEKGGVITGPNLRIQAQRIIYTRKMEEGQPIYTIVAEGDLMLEFGDSILVGERLEYDFQTSTGVLYYGRSGIGSWYVGGQKIALFADKSYSMTNGFITTSDNIDSDWHIEADEAFFTQERYLQACQVRFKLFHTTLFWLPSLSLDLKAIQDIPMRYHAGWGGRQGPRLGVSYEIFSWNHWKTFLRLDVRLNRGVGTGLETYYHSLDYSETFEAINYFALDSSIFHPKETYRYRFQGAYHNQLCDDRLTIDLTYDKLSDKYMAIDYADQSLDIETAGRTQLDIRRQEDCFISNLIARARINSFETVKQELPTLLTSWKPFEVYSTGIIADHKLELSYLDFAYANSLQHVHDYRAPRLAHQQNYYRPFHLGMLSATPEAGSTLIYYGNSPQHTDRWLAIGLLGCTFKTPFYRFYGSNKHVITPYARYHYFTFPTTSPKDHFIFDIDDGWYRLNMLRFGLSQNFYIRSCDGFIRRYLSADLYANAFFDTKTIPRTIPKVYSEIVLYPTLRLRHSLDIAWDFEEHQLDHCNFRTQWTYSPDFAISAEFRYRDAFDWRKADRENFILDSFRDIKELVHSSVSDPRGTALLHFFYRFHPNWAIEFESRYGWHRRNKTRYTEFEIDLIGNLRSSMQARVSYQHKESEDRFTVYFTFWPRGPEGANPYDGVPTLAF